MEPLRAETASTPIEKTEAQITVNIFGAVKKRGAYLLPTKSTLWDAIVAAGGLAPPAKQNQVSIVRGPAGEKPAVTLHDVNAILRGKTANPPVLDHDSIFVPEAIF